MSSVTYQVSRHKAIYNGRTLDAWVPEFVDTILHSFDPAKVNLFGSLANPSDGPNSDIDLLVVLDYAPSSDVESSWRSRICAPPKSSDPGRGYAVTASVLGKSKDLQSFVDDYSTTDGFLGAYQVEVASRRRKSGLNRNGTVTMTC